MAQLTATELLSQLMAGDRDFSKSELSASDAGLGAEARYADLVAYLTGQDLANNPILAEEARWAGLVAPGLFSPGAKFQGIDLTNANLSRSHLRRADLTGASLDGIDFSDANIAHIRLTKAQLVGSSLAGADLYEANLGGASFQNADLSGSLLLRTNLRDVDLTGANLRGCDLYRTDLRGVKGLETVSGLGSCRFRQTVVTAVELEVIQAAQAQMMPFDLRKDNES